MRDCPGACVFEPTLHHAADVVDVNATRGDLAGFANGCRKERRILRRSTEACGIEVIEDDAFEIMPYRNLPGLAALLFEVEH